jgi:hypothetical protein
MGSFLSEDPLDHEIIDPQGRDEYAYGSGDPVNRVDVNGLCSYGGCEPTAANRRAAIASWALNMAETTLADAQPKDCANFASHALNAAGYPMALAGLTPGKSNTKAIAKQQGSWKAWFMIKPTDGRKPMPSYSWYNSQGLYKYLLDSRRGKVRQVWVVPDYGQNYKGDYVLPSGIKIGDLVFCHWTPNNNKFDHVMIVGWIFPKNILFAQHDPNVLRNINDLLHGRGQHTYASLTFVEPQL